MSTNKKVTVETNPVSWAGETAIKFQSHVACVIDPNRTIRIFGDPESTEAKAFESLKREYAKWKFAIFEMSKLLKPET